MSVPRIAHWAATLLAAATGPALADVITDTSFATDFESASGYIVGELAPSAEPLENQPLGPEWWHNWLDTYNRRGVLVTTERAHGGAQAIKFTGSPDNPDEPICSAHHITVIDADPCTLDTFEWRPMSWVESFWVYVPSAVPHGAIALRAEPWNNWTRLCANPPVWEGFSYQFFIYRVDDGLTNGWRPQIGIDAQANDLRDEMGLDPLFDSFATDTWWNVTITADGAAYIVTSVTIRNDAGQTYTADPLNDCFSSWGEPCPGVGGDNYCSRPERVFYYGYRGVFMDDIELKPLGGVETKPGDYDCDGDIDFFDIDLLLAALGGEQAWIDKYMQKFGTAPPCTYANADANEDGVVDFFDIDAFIGLLGT